MKYTILVLTLLTWTCHSLTVKDLLPCKDTNVPMINSVVLVNCTEEPCFFGKDNGLSMQFIITPEKPAATVWSDITAEDIWGKEYLVEAKQRTSCAYSYCQLEPKVPRCFSSVVRRKKRVLDNSADMYRFKVKFMDQNSKLIACSRFLLATYIKLKKTHKPVYSTSYQPYVYTPSSYESSYSANYKPSYAQVSVELPKPSYSYSSSYNYDYKPYGTSKEEPAPVLSEIDSGEMEDDEFRLSNVTAPASSGNFATGPVAPTAPTAPVTTTPSEAVNWHEDSSQDEMVFLEDVPKTSDGEIDEIPPFDDFARGKGLIFNSTQGSGTSGQATATL